MRIAEYTLTNGETFSPLRDDGALALLAKKLHVSQENATQAAVSAIVTDNNFRASLKSVWGQAIASSTLFNLPPQTEPEEDIWQAFERVLSQFPKGALADLPKDLSTNHDHYLYGTPKKS